MYLLCIGDYEKILQYMRPGVTKGTLRRKNENSFFGVLCLRTFNWSY